MRSFYIRVDGNELIATGHVMRCLSIAEQLRKMEIDTVFLTADEKPLAMIEGKGFEGLVLGTCWDDLDGELPILCDMITKRGILALLVDSYSVTKDYLETLSQYTKIIYMDDLLRFAYPVHTVINYDAFVEPGSYGRLYAGTGRQPSLLLGSRYIPLRDEFRGTSAELRKEMKKVLVTTGGSDQLNVGGTLLQAVMADHILRNLEYHVIIGRFHRHQKLLRDIAARYANVFLHENVKEMSRYMRDCDAAVSAGGTTLYELCACGIPTVCLEVAANQEGAAVWEEKGCMLYAGNAQRDKKACITNCVELLKRYKGNYEMRCGKSAAMRTVVDGRGAERIAGYVRKTMERIG